MDLGLRDRVVLITGAGGGAGRRARASRPRARPWRSINAAGRRRLPTRAEATAADIVASRRPGRGRQRRSDLDRTDRGDGRRGRRPARAGRRPGDGDVRIQHRRFAEVNDETWASIVDDMLGATFRTCRAVVPGWQEAGWGRIVNIAARSGLVGRRGPPTTPRPRRGSSGLTASLAKELGPSRDPRQRRGAGQILTVEGRRADDPRGAGRRTGKKIPLRRVATPDDLASLVVWLGSAPTRFVPGETISLTRRRPALTATARSPPDAIHVGPVARRPQSASRHRRLERRNDPRDVRPAGRLDASTGRLPPSILAGRTRSRRAATRYSQLDRRHPPGARTAHGRHHR